MANARKTDSRLPRQPRRGWATLWMIIWLPALLALFCAMVGIANLWLARVELENSMEAAALAAVKQWGDANGGDTLIPRQVGQAYAAANCVRKIDVAIGTNYNPANGPNQNGVCPVGMTPPTGNLIFGAIDDTDPNNIIFNAGIQPSCGIGTVLFDASAQGQSTLGADNAWGVAFLDTATTPANLRIVRIVYDLQANGGNGVFVLGAAGPADGPTISDSLPEAIIRDVCNNSTVYEQPDVAGFTDPAAQIVFTPTGGNSPTLQIDFLPDANPIGGIDDGFAPCDRFRFGALTEDVADGPPGNDNDDGDGVGADAVQVTVFFELGGVPLPPVTGNFFDNNTEGSNDCICPPGVDPFCGDLIPHPANIPNLPCPPASANTNNGQSYVLLSGDGNRKFGVRAQAIIPVADFGCVFLGTVPPGCVQAKATAIYDCTTRRPRLIRIDKFICPGPDEADGVIICDFCAPGP
jgi:hypothetical protein